MTYIENVFICMASPLLIAALCMGRRQAKFFLCCLAGMGACLLSAYINTFFAALYAADTMHVICGAIVGGGLAYVWQRTWLKIAGTCGLLGAAITFHAIYNLLIAYGGAIQYIAYILPVLILAVGKLIVRLPQSHN